MSKTLVIILGPHAVGKMTVGQELAKITDLRLFHNHMSIELTRKLFAHTEPEWQILNEGIRRTVEYMMTHLECQVEDPEFDDWCDRIIEVLENAKKAMKG